MLPPGRARLSITPASTGSRPPPIIMIGIVLVALAAARLARNPPPRGLYQTLHSHVPFREQEAERYRPRRFDTRWKYCVLRCNRTPAAPAESPPGGWSPEPSAAWSDNRFAQLSPVAAHP